MNYMFYLDNVQIVFFTDGASPGQATLIGGSGAVNVFGGQLSIGQLTLSTGKLLTHI